MECLLSVKSKYSRKNSSNNIPFLFYSYRVFGRLETTPSERADNERVIIASADVRLIKPIKIWENKGFAIFFKKQKFNIIILMTDEYLISCTQ